MDNHLPLGEDSDIIRSHNVAETSLMDKEDEEGDNRMETLLGAATFLVIVKDDGVSPAVVPRVSVATSIVVTGTLSCSPLLSRMDFLLHC